MLRLKKKAKEEERVIVYADESGFGLTPNVGKTWHMKGKTRVLRTNCKYKHLSVAGGISESGEICYTILQRSFTGKSIVEFLKKMQGFYKKKLTVIWDGAAIHNSKEVKEFLEKNGDKIRLVRQPAYSPEVNPIELMWGYLKKNKLSNFVGKDLDCLQEWTDIAFESLIYNPSIVQAFFRHPAVAFY